MLASLRASFTCCMRQARLDDALELLDERSAEFVEEHSSWFSSNRIWLLGEAYEDEEALAYAETLPPDMYGLTVSKAWILDEMGRVEEALALLRADTEVRPSEVAELLIRHGRAAEAIAGMPSLAEQHAASRRRDAAAQADQGPNDPSLLTSLCRVGGEASKASTWLRVHICRAEVRSAVCWWDSSPAMAWTVWLMCSPRPRWRVRARQFFKWAMPCSTRIRLEECSLRWRRTSPRTSWGRSS